MAHNFIKGINTSTGAALASHYFVSESGSDANAGTPDLPKRTIEGAVAAIGSSTGHTIVVSTGTYTPASLALPPATIVAADGFMVLQGTGTLPLFDANSAANRTFKVFIISNDAYLSNNAANLSRTVTFDGCLVFDSDIRHTFVYGFVLFNSTFMGCTIEFARNSYARSNNAVGCRFIASTLNTKSYAKNCVTDGDSKFYNVSKFHGGTANNSYEQTDYN
ncbi:hypothetical protein [Rufibacter latericius]|uniref:DUF1565 domain-containing protein n=1 Tax=Rufibacter latericius TaxID=2487040 RepID=A0A3M9M903_9BACT|nr:hypothetical protein [Rufibacter latericius]RNI22039.1 hypothetical protein EFB08_23185 [Rufibacter latericius]